MRHLRYRFDVLKMFSTQVPRVGEWAIVGMLSALRGLVGRVGYELVVLLVVSRGRIESRLAQLLLLFGRQLGLDVYLGLVLLEAALVGFGVGRLVLAGGDAPDGRWLKVVRILQVN